MSRFFKSAAFPILIVVVLAFFAQRLISPDEPTSTPDYPGFLAQIDRGVIERAEMRQKDNTVEVTLRDGNKYDVGWVEQQGDELTNQLLRAERSGKIDQFDVVGRKSNGWLSLLTYVLPFLIFI